MKNILTNLDYTALRSDTKVTKVSDYINETDNSIHDVLLKAALIKLAKSDDYDWTLYNSLYNRETKEEYEMFYTNKKIDDEKIFSYFINLYDITEIRDDDMLEPSICRFRQKHWPFRTWKVDMNPYWNNEYMKETTYTKHVGITNNDPIVSFNYVNGTARTRGKLDGEIKEIPFSKVNADSIVSEECDLDKTTFTYLYKYN